MTLIHTHTQIPYFKRVVYAKLLLIYHYTTLPFYAQVIFEVLH